MSKILRVDMAAKSCVFEDTPDEYKGLGGRGLTSAVTALEVEPLCHPLGPKNKLIFAPGLLGGTRCANANRISVGCKSPLTGGIKESNSGGLAGGRLAMLDIQAVIIENAVSDGAFLQLEIEQDQAKLVPAKVAGLNNYEAAARLKDTYGKDCCYILIGRAGEFRLSAASIAFTDQDDLPTRHAARGGVGAVMGSKGLKAVIVKSNPLNRLPIYNPEMFNNAARRFAAILSAHPICGGSLATYGSAGLAGIINEAGALPTRNFRTGSFEGQIEISAEKMFDAIQDRGKSKIRPKGCTEGCIIQCSSDYPDKHGKSMGKRPEFESLWAFGANTGTRDLDSIVRCNRLCDDIGVDTIDVGGAMALLMEAGVLQFGDTSGALRILEEIGEGTPLGRILGSGVTLAGKIYGMHRVPEVKGQGLSAFDPRAIKGQGVTFATNPMGADHTSGFTVPSNLLNVGEIVDPLQREGQTGLSRASQITAAAVDTLGLCLFVSYAVLDEPAAMSAIVDMVNARFGWDLTLEGITSLGKKVLAMEIAFNKKTGFSPSSDRLPEFLLDEKSSEHGASFDISSEELDTVLTFIKD